MEQVMKAITFSEFFGMKLNEKIEYANKFGDENMPIYDRKFVEKSLNMWYYAKTQQPFRPELIVELFKGFVDGALCYSGGDREIEIVSTMDYYFITTDRQFCFPMPKLTDDFIHDCSQAGIDLEWKI